MPTIPQKPRLQAAAAALALAISASAAGAETVDGLLEPGDDHSVLWMLSPESGDLIGLVFANASQPGEIILARCQPDQRCLVEGALLAEPEPGLVEQLHFSEQPSGWWAIEHAAGARLPVAASPPPPPAPPPAAAIAPVSKPAAQPTLLARVIEWWDTRRAALRRWLLALFGR